MRVATPLVVLLLLGCSPTPVADTPEPQPTSASSPEPQTQPSPAPSGSAVGEIPLLKRPGKGSCKLDAPKLSQDSCKTDADCGVSAPCHAPECVAKAKSNPPKPDTMCTMSLECKTADANRCGCHEGFCALIPPADE